MRVAQSGERKFARSPRYECELAFAVATVIPPGQPGGFRAFCTLFAQALGRPAEVGDGTGRSPHVSLPGHLRGQMHRQTGVPPTRPPDLCAVVPAANGRCVGGRRVTGEPCPWESAWITIFTGLCAPPPVATT
jgi:hypothetical protein